MRRVLSEQALKAMTFSQTRNYFCNPFLKTTVLFVLIEDGIPHDQQVDFGSNKATKKRPRAYTQQVRCVR
jgi:hypothetical protein